MILNHLWHLGHTLCDELLPGLMLLLFLGVLDTPLSLAVGWLFRLMGWLVDMPDWVVNFFV